MKIKTNEPSVLKGYEVMSVKQIKKIIIIEKG